MIHWCCAQTNPVLELFVKISSIKNYHLYSSINSTTSLLVNYACLFREWVKSGSGTPEPEDFIMDLPMDSSNGYHQEQITRCMKVYIPNIKFLDERGLELRYLVPLDQPHLLARLFDQLDSNIGVMGIASYGLSACSMEQVFVALNEECSDVSTDGKCS